MESGESHIQLPPIELEKPMEGLESYTSQFMNDRLAEFQDLKKSFESRDFENLKRISHNWKGFCEPYGFTGLGILAEALELAAKEQSIEASFQMIQQIDLYLKRKNEFLGTQNV